MKKSLLLVLLASVLFVCAQVRSTRAGASSFQAFLRRYLNTGVSGNLGFTVAIELQEEVRLGGQQNPTQRALRVTQIFRKEGGAWKLMHRQADPLMEKKAPSAVSQQ